MQCEICNKENAHRHHIISVGAYGGKHVKTKDNPGNIIYLCAEHHVGPCGVHVIGRETFFKKWGLEYKLDIAKALQRINNGGSK